MDWFSHHMWLTLIIYISVGITIFIIPALFGDNDSVWGPVALFWPPILACIIVAAPFGLFFGGLSWLQDFIAEVAKARIQNKKNKEPEIVNVEPPKEPDYRHMNCTTCGKVL